MQRLYFWKKWEGKKHHPKPGFWHRHFEWRLSKNMTADHMADRDWDTLLKEEEEMRLKKIEE